MKKLILSAIVLLATVVAFAQSEKFTAAMKKNLSAMDSSFKNAPELLNVANNFERIANAEKNQWLPYYYAAFCQVNYGFMEPDKDKIDGYADKATLLIAKADSLSPNNSEISCIKSMIASCHLMVNPMQRWQEYGQESSSNMDAAIHQDATNPRPYFLKGQGLKYTPEQFGGGCKTAKPQLQTALDKYATFKPASDISPNWGKERVENLMKDCK
ncbi:hypothetical protein [Ferruginibacter sp.]|uniref:hypothetical protein n=1 Tax=Ferruginibacter sp. TaxID=1940288 RepID=UPI00265AE017|nr:hypothetical protein [Ferruginibacter sp.]